jgi:hypothetical protein
MILLFSPIFVQFAQTFNIDKVFEYVTVGCGNLVGVFVAGVKNNERAVPSRKQL